MLPLALLMTRQAYSLDRNKPLGRQSAGAGLLESYLRYGQQQRHQIVVAQDTDGPWFHQEALRFNPHAETVIHRLDRWGDATENAGNILLPGAGLDEWAWKRMPGGDGAFSLVGLVHTLCSRSVQWGLGQFATAPVRPWDALICTSTAARAVVEGFFERQEEWLQQRLGAQNFERPQLPVIPLGVHSQQWEPPGGSRSARAMSRKKLGIDDQADVVLIAGRLDFLTKFHPEPLLKVLANLKAKTHPNLELVVYGEAPNETMRELWQQGAHEIPPKLKIHWIAGRRIELAGTVRWAADIFVSLADNPQETFGITPLEAMAPGLPCVVSDWDGYRDTIVQPGESEDATGFRITTRMIEGLGQEESAGLLNDTLPYDLTIGRISQGIAVDLCELEEKLYQLLSNEDLRKKMGATGKNRNQQLYQWKVVIRKWKEMLDDLKRLRDRANHSGKSSPEGELPPWLPRPSTSFKSLATEILPNTWHPLEPPTEHEEQTLHMGTMQNWDQTIMGGPLERRQAWWLKNGLTEA